ncbi:MAG: hypothetical protein IKW85_14095 [Muribaculaceae bacterium]|nr:hypothetical protein [Muribaculaceae bacterium]
MKYLAYFLLSICAVTLLSSCEHDEPINPIKPLEDRTVLVLTSYGEIFDQTGKLVKELPNCTFASEIIAEGDDYFVAGVSSKERVGYWKNGKWNTLHVDFIEDVDHWIYGIGKWDSYIYLLDLPNVLKNSGIFPLKDSEFFIPPDHGLVVSEGKCYVIGYEPTNVENVFRPILYNYHKGYYEKEYLPLPPGYITGECRTIYASNGDHTVIGGIVGREPAVWVDKQCQIYQVSFPELLEEGYYPVGRIECITECNGHVYAAGFEYNADRELIATVWIDGIPQHYQYNPDCDGSSQAIGIRSYGDDVYVLTTEFDPIENDLLTHLWLNGKIIMSYHGIQPAGFAVL